MPASKIIAGASGYSYKEWKGDFYPSDIRPEGMLKWYADRLPTVELNNTFYRLPRPGMVDNWARIVPEHFRFAIKASQRITHSAKLQADKAADPLAFFYRTLAALGPKRGPVLFQLPPYLRKDLACLTEFLALLPAEHRAAFEFRHDSWFADDVFEALRKAGAMLCLSEREDAAPPPLVETASDGYLRLRLEHYEEADLRRWAERLAATGWQEIHAYFMHEPTAPAYAIELMKCWSALRG